MVALVQLYALGFTRRQVARLVRDGHLVWLHRGVYATGHEPLTAKGRWMAAVLACGPGAVLSHQAAAALWDLGAASGRIDVTRAGHGRRSVRGVRYHGVRHLHPRDGTIIDSIPVTSLARTLLDLSEILNHYRLTSVLEAAQRREILDLHRINELLERSNGRRGVPLLRRAVEDLGEGTPWTQSVLEERFLQLLRAAQLPLPQTNVVVDGYVVDCFWPEHDLVVELDSYGFHRSRRAFELDRRKDAAHDLAGRRHLRVSRERVQDEADALTREFARRLTRPRRVSSRR